jgi:hypothetical protein
VAYCAPHGREHRVAFRCERCGEFSPDVERVLMLGHRTQPAKRTRGAKTTGHLLCGDCVQRMEREQLDLFGGAA